MMWIAVAALLSRCVLAVLYPVVDPTEGRHAQMAAELAQGQSSWIIPLIRVQGDAVPFMGKPPIPVWAMAASVRFFGQHEWAIRLPQGLCSLFVCLLVWRTVQRFEPAGSWPAVCILFASPFFFALMLTATYDPWLMLGVSGATLCYANWAVAGATRFRWSLGIFAGLAVGFLSKGLVAVALFGIPVFVWTWRFRGWTDLRLHAWGRGFVIFFVPVIGWLAFAEAHHPGFLKYFLWNEQILRYLVEDYGDRYGSGHVYPYGTAALLFLAGIGPVGWWMMMAAHRVPKVEASHPVRSLLVYTMIAHVVFFCFARQLLWTYLLPAMPLFATWCGLRVPRQKPIRAWIIPFSIFVWSLTLALWLPVAGQQRSTRHVFEKLPSSVSSLTFLPKTPSSAFWYLPQGVRLNDHPSSYPGSLDAIPEAMVADLYVLDTRECAKGHFQFLLGNTKYLKVERGWHLVQPPETLKP